MEAINHWKEEDLLYHLSISQKKTNILYNKLFDVLQYLFTLYVPSVFQ